MNYETTDILVIGSGAAGLFFAQKAARFADVTILTKKDACQSNTYYAQGGIASVMDREDSFELHISDTVEAGKGLCDEEAVDIMVREGPERIKELLSLGIRFSKDSESGSFELGREGGHSAPRIVHFRDLMGRELEDSLVKIVTSNPRIRLLDSHLAIDLIKDHTGRITGCFALDRESNTVKTFFARHTVLATGGAGKIYLYTSNPDVAMGDGIAMAYRAGAAIANLEFVQFHPTCLYHADVRSLLVTEALRGEGAVLTDLAGREFMAEYDRRRELAPRDIVARAIDHEMKKSGAKHVLLDITHRPSKWLRERFPYVYENCLKLGLDIGTDPIPVVPAAHYMCGGVQVGMDGRTRLDGLFAIGEVSCSGVHGANRLASNSLLEVLVVSHRCAAFLERELPAVPPAHSCEIETPPMGDPETLETVILDHDWDLTRRVMWDYVGIVRSDERLNIARERVDQIKSTVERIYSEYGISTDIVELRNIALVSSLVIASAISRKESRGLHYMLDYPDADPAYRRDTIMLKPDDD